MEEKEAEEWRPVVGYEGKYIVSSFGNVKSLLRKGRGGGEYMGYSLRAGYRKVTLCNNGNRRDNTISRIVGEAFHKNPSRLPQINHKDENKLNDRADNLEWCTVLYNNRYGTKPSRTSAALVGRFGVAVNQLTIDGVFLKKWNCMSDIKRSIGAKVQNISKVCLGRKISTYGYKWEYAEEE